MSPAGEADVRRARGLHVSEGAARGVVRAEVLVGAARLLQLRLVRVEVQHALARHAPADVVPPRAVRVHDAVVEHVAGGGGAGDVLRAHPRLFVLVVPDVALLHKARAANQQPLRNVGRHTTADDSHAQGLDRPSQLVLDGGGLPGQRGVVAGLVGLQDRVQNQLNLDTRRHPLVDAQELRRHHLAARECLVHSHDGGPHVLRDRVRGGGRVADVAGLRWLREDQGHVVRRLLLVAARVLPRERVLALEVVGVAVGARALVRLGVTGGAGVAVLPAVGVLHARHKRVRQRRPHRVHVACHTRQVAAQLVVALARNTPRRGSAGAARNRRRLPLLLERAAADGGAHRGAVVRVFSQQVSTHVSAAPAHVIGQLDVPRAAGDALRLARRLAAGRLVAGASHGGALDRGVLRPLHQARRGALPSGR